MKKPFLAALHRSNLRFEVAVVVAVAVEVEVVNVLSWLFIELD